MTLDDSTLPAPVTVLHIRSSVYPGGPETTLIGWFRYADRSRFDHRLLVFDERGGLHQRSVQVFESHGIGVELLPWAPAKRLVAAVRAIRSRMRPGVPCILHAHDVRSDFVALVAGRLAGVPVVVSNHAWHAQGLKRHLQEALRARWLPYADLVVNVSEDTHQETMRRGVPAERSIAMYSGLDLEPYRQVGSVADARALFGLGPDDIVVSNVARMWPEKAIAALIEATAQLATRHPRLRVLQVGDGPLMDELRADVERRGLQTVFRFLGFRSDYVQAMRASDIFALPSLAEGMPMVIYSAMALGLPIVTSDVNGMRDVLQHESTALIMRPGQADDLVAAIERLIADNGLAHRLGAQARQTMESRFSAEQAVRRLEGWYTEVISRRRPVQPEGGKPRFG